MIEVYTGSAGTITITTYEDGVPTQPASSPTVTISDAETDEVLDSGVASLIDSYYEGEYEYSLPTSITNADRVLKASWSYVVNGKTINEIDYVYVVTPYATVDEIISELGYSSQPEDQNYYPYEKIKSAERAARMMIEDYLGFSMGKRIDSVVAYGNNTDVLLLQTKIITFSKLYENDELVIDNVAGTNIFGYDLEATETGYGLRIIPNSPGDDIDEYESLSATGYIKGRFKDGYRYKAEGVFGWKYIPSEIKQCMFLLVNDLLCSESSWRTKYVRKITTSQNSVEISSLAFTGTGNAIVDSILQKFKMVQAVVI